MIGIMNIAVKIKDNGSRIKRFILHPWICKVFAEFKAIHLIVLDEFHM